MATQGTKTYSADLVTLTFGGRLIDSGYADGEFVSIEPASDDYSNKVGSDGEVAIARTNDQRATAKVKLLQTSTGNRSLTQMRNLGLASPTGAFVGVFQVVDRASGEVLCRCRDAVIQKPPSPSRAREVGEYEWTIFLPHAVFDLNGSISV